MDPENQQEQQAPTPSDRPEGETNQPGGAVVEETVTTTEQAVTTADTSDSPSTPAQDVVDTVHERQADQTVVAEEPVVKETTTVTQFPDAGRDQEIADQRAAEQEQARQERENLR